MHELVLTPQFERSFKRLVGKHPAMRAKIETTLRRMAEDINDPRLRTHHLIGQLADFLCLHSELRLPHRFQQAAPSKDKI